jgi:pheromone a factor receptor
MSSNRNLNRGRYYRLMALALVDVLCTVPLAAYGLYLVVGLHLGPWQSWSKTHNGDHYSRIVQVPASIWMNIPHGKFTLEAPRWLVVWCALLFFAFFGFADEARQHYRLVFKSLATRAGYSTTSLTLQGSSHAYVVHHITLVLTRAQRPFSTSSLPYMKNKGEISVSVTTSGNKRDSMSSFADQLSIPSISLPSGFKPDMKIEEYSPTDSMASSSMDSLELERHRASHHGVVTLPTLPPASVPPHRPDSVEVTVRAYSSDAGNAV